MKEAVRANSKLFLICLKDNPAPTLSKESGNAIFPNDSSPRFMDMGIEIFLNDKNSPTKQEITRGFKNR